MLIFSFNLLPMFRPILAPDKVERYQTDDNYPPPKEREHIIPGKTIPEGKESKSENPGFKGLNSEFRFALGHENLRGLKDGEIGVNNLLQLFDSV